MSSNNPHQFDLHYGPFLSKPSSDDWDTEPEETLRTDRDQFLELRQKPGGMDEFEEVLAARDGSEDYVEWYRQYDRALAHIEQEAQELAIRFALDQARIQRILERSSYHRLADPLDRSFTRFEDAERHGVWIRPKLVDALESLPAEQALSLYEAADLSDLSQRVLVTESLDNARLYTLEELEDLLDRFLSYLLRNQGHVVSTGFPKTSFERFPWLERKLSKTYYTKLPTEIRKEMLPVSEGGVRPVRPDADYLAPERRYVLEWQAAGRLDWLSAEDAERLSSLREQLVELKASILAAIVDGVKDRDIPRMWMDCLRLLTDALTLEQVEFLLGVDSLYKAHSMELQLSCPPLTFVGWEPGGLSQVFEAIWYVEEELTVGLWRRTREALGDLVELDSLGRPQPTVRDYFRVIGKPQQQLLDDALDLHFRVREELAEHADVFERRIHDLAEELSEQPTLPDGHRETGQFIIESVKEALPGLLAELPGSAPAGWTGSRQSAEPPEPQQYVFVKENDVWGIVYEGKEQLVPHRKGMYDIGQLLSNPGKLLAVEWLDYLVPEPKARTGKAPYKIRQELEELGLVISGPGHVGEAFVRADRDQLEEARDRYRQTAEEAAALGKMEEAQDARDQAAKIDDYISKNIDLRGRPRKQADEADKIRKRVSKRIHETIGHIGAAGHEALAQHLDGCLRTGFDCIYAPKPTIPWMT